MRALPTIVVAQAIVLIVLFLNWTQRTAPLVPAGSPVLAAEAGDATAASGELAAAGTASPAALARERATANSATQTGAATSIVLQGKLLGVEPPPDPDSVRLFLRRLDRWSGAEVTKRGSFAVAGLTEGVWRLRCEVPGYQRLDFPATIGSAPVQRLDLTLTKAPVLTVYASTTDGKRLATELAKLGLMAELRVVASATPRTGDFEPTENSSIGDSPIGRFRAPSDRNQATDANTNDGTLELDQPPPAHAALVLRHMVLAQLPIEPGQTELRFVVDPATVFARMPKVRVRVLGPDGNPAAARVSLSTAQTGGGGQKTDEHGVVVLENVPPGLNYFEIWAKDAEQWNGHVTIPSTGGEVDLGDHRLTAAQPLHGRIVDEAGAPASGNVQWTALDTWRPPHPLADRRSTESDGDGKFQLYGTGRRRYTVKVRGSAGRYGFAFVDGATAGAVPFVVTLRPARKLHLDATKAGTRCVVVADATGQPFDVRRIEPQWPLQVMSLPDGDYQLIVYDGAGRELQRERLVVAGADLQKELP